MKRPMKTILCTLVTLLLVASTAHTQQPFSTQSLTAMSAGAACPDPGCMIVDVQGLASAGVQITGTWTQTLQFEQSIDKATWATWAVTPNAGGASVTSTTANGLWFGSLAGAKWIRVRVSAFTSGTAVVSMQAAQARLNIGPVPRLVAVGRFTAQTAAQATVATYTPAADGTFEISGDVTVTAFSACAIRVEVDFNSEDNIARAINLPLWNANAFGITAGCASADVWHSSPITIRAKAGVAIVLKTAGTFTSVTYNVDGLIKQVA